MASRQPQFRTREDHRERIEVHVAGFCFRRSSGRLELLVGHRIEEREPFPGLWECGGGQVRAGENFVEALSRQFFEEFGIEIDVIQPILTYEIVRAGGPKIPGLKFLCASRDNGKEQIVLNPRRSPSTGG